MVRGALPWAIYDYSSAGREWHWLLAAGRLVRRRGQRQVTYSNQLCQR